MRAERHNGGTPTRLAFEVEWPVLARRLEAALNSKKMPRGLIEDVVQETGLRLFEIWDRVDPEREPWPLALTIALNLVRDQIRTEARRQQVVAPEELIGHSAERSALARLELLEIRDALSQLTAAQRSALLAEVGLDADPLESASALKMLRMRARRRLRSLIEGASALVTTAELNLLRFTRAGAAPGGEQLAPALSLAAGMICLATLAPGSQAEAAPTQAARGHALETRAGAPTSTPLGAALANAYSHVTQSDRNAATRFLTDLVETSRTGARKPDAAAAIERPDRVRSIRTAPPIGSGPSHEEEVTIGPNGYKAGGRVGTRAGSHVVEASVESGGEVADEPAQGCGRRAVSGRSCSKRSPADVYARARAELDEKGIELGVGGRRSS